VQRIGRVRRLHLCWWRIIGSHLRILALFQVGLEVVEIAEFLGKIVPAQLLEHVTDDFDLVLVLDHMENIASHDLPKLGHLVMLSKSHCKVCEFSELL
jgi:hypothetical protein